MLVSSNKLLKEVKFKRHPSNAKVTPRATSGFTGYDLFSAEK